MRLRGVLDLDETVYGIKIANIDRVARPQYHCKNENIATNVPFRVKLAPLVMPRSQHARRSFNRAQTY